MALIATSNWAAGKTIVVDGNVVKCITDAKLVFTPVPPRSKLPLTVTVVAWQWGRASEPAIQTAQNVERTFQLTK